MAFATTEETSEKQEPSEIYPLFVKGRNYNGTTRTEVTSQPPNPWTGQIQRPSKPHETTRTDQIPAVQELTQPDKFHALHTSSNQLAPIFRPYSDAFQAPEKRKDAPDKDYPTIGAEEEPETENLQEDPNCGRRKRQRTESPSVPVTGLIASAINGEGSHNGVDSWLDQLKHAASGQVLDEQPGFPEVLQALHIPHTMTGPDMAVNSATLRPELESVGQIAGQHDGLGDEKVMESIQNPPRDRTPKKRTMKLSAKGKLLSSPQATDIVAKRSPSRTKVQRKATGPSKIVILKYDSSPRSTIAQKIVDILLVDHSVTLPGLSKKIQEPAKTTHPFFLGTSKRKSAEESTAEISVTPRKTQDHKKVMSSTPVKRRIDTTESINLPPGVPFPSLSPNQACPLQVTTFSRNPDHLPVLWPPREFEARQRRLNSANPIHAGISNRVKAKSVLIAVPDNESVLRTLISRRVLSLSDAHPGHEVRLPLRRLMTGLDALSLAQKGTTSLPTIATRSTHVHTAVEHLRSLIPRSTSSFDLGTCDQVSWTSKYAPASAGEVLQPGFDVTYLRDWLHSLTVSIVGSSKTSGRKPQENLRKHRKKRAKRVNMDLDDFVVSTDDESNDLEEVDDSANEATFNTTKTKRSAFRSTASSSQQSSRGLTKNSILISGPHGCGKTAAVFAVAKELGFEVFEINAGSRRSAKDIFDRVGDMTQNHLVGKSESRAGSAGERVEPTLGDDSTKKDIDSGKQGTMTAFLTKNATAREPNPSLPKHAALPTKATADKPQKDSLILLEEVDVIFEDDRSFWPAVISLIVQSKRPVIMTCADENLIPVQDLSLEAILRFDSPPPEIVTDYLVAMAACEGHVVSRRSIADLYHSQRRDLRSSIMDLDYWCQMAVGSSKGSIDWMFDKAKEERRDVNGNRCNIISVDTYQSDMSLVPRRLLLDLEVGDTLERLLSFVRQEHDISMLAWLSRASMRECGLALSTGIFNDTSALEDLKSHADMMMSTGLNAKGHRKLDPGYPEVSGKTSLSYVEGYPLLNDEELMEYGDLSSDIVASMISISRSRLDYPALKEPDNFIMVERESSQTTFRKDLMLDALAAVEIEKPVFPSSTGRLAPNLEDSPAVLGTEIAPYVRYIAGYDQRLEQQREALSQASSPGSRRGKRARTTRASRAALEGGSKAETRREKWFHQTLNYDLLAQTGGPSWQNILLEQLSRDGIKCESDGTDIPGPAELSTSDTATSPASSVEERIGTRWSSDLARD